MAVSPSEQLWSERPKRVEPAQVNDDAQESGEGRAFHPGTRASTAGHSHALDVYTHGHHESVLRSHEWRTAQNSAAYLLSNLEPGMDVLDVGCGPGTITLDLAHLVSPGRVLGIDPAADVVAAAQRHASERGDETTRFEAGDVYQLGEPDDSYDVVHAHQVLQHLTDPVAALREMRRVCRPGGLIAIRDSDYAAMTWFPANGGLTDWLDLYHRVARANGAEPDAGRALRSWTLRAGFDDVRCSASAWVFATPDERAWWGSLWADRCQHSAFAAQALGGGHATKDQLADIAAAWQSWAAADDAWFAVLHGEILAVA
jgi:2-polyprenyl-3-methyl-5-hydroxy-6-metoxy-1,4-benzoquinol methylase